MTENITNEQLILEIEKRGLLTSAHHHGDILKNRDFSGIKIILSRGTPPGEQNCSRCLKPFAASEFSRYQARVSKTGYLQRSNAWCSSCHNDHKMELNRALKDVVVPPKPKKGDECSHCERTWDGNWHRHHQGESFLGWLCGHCNMSFSDHRNKEVNEKRKNDV